MLAPIYFSFNMINLDFLRIFHIYLAKVYLDEIQSIYVHILFKSFKDLNELSLLCLCGKSDYVPLFSWLMIWHFGLTTWIIWVAYPENWNFLIEKWRFKWFKLFLNNLNPRKVGIESIWNETLRITKSWEAAFTLFALWDVKISHFSSQ